MGKSRLILTVALLAILIASCKRSTPTGTKVVLVGGLGHNQLIELQSKIPESTTTGDDDGYKKDLGEYKNCDVIIGHSFGCYNISRWRDSFAGSKLAIFIDPVQLDWQPEMIGPNIKTIVFYRKQLLGPKTAKIIGPDVTEYIINADHNSIAHDATVTSQILQEITNVTR